MTGIAPPIKKWIIFMYSRRSIKLSIGEFCLRKIVTRGTQQGVVVLPLLRLIALNVILSHFEERGSVSV